MSTTIGTIQHTASAEQRSSKDRPPRRPGFRRRSRTELARAAEASPEWIFPDGDELFRGIYTRAGTGFASDVLAVCSAIAGEGRTTVGVGLAVTIAQDFPDRRGPAGRDRPAAAGAGRRLRRRREPWPGGLSDQRRAAAERLPPDVPREFAHRARLVARRRARPTAALEPAWRPSSTPCGRATTSSSSTCRRF